MEASTAAMTASVVQGGSHCSVGELTAKEAGRGEGAAVGGHSERSREGEGAQREKQGDECESKR